MWRTFLRNQLSEHPGQVSLKSAGTLRNLKRSLTVYCRSASPSHYTWPARERRQESQRLVTKPLGRIRNPTNLEQNTRRRGSPSCLKAMIEYGCRLSQIPSSWRCERFPQVVVPFPIASLFLPLSLH